MLLESATAAGSFLALALTNATGAVTAAAAARPGHGTTGQVGGTAPAPVGGTAAPPASGGSGASGALPHRGAIASRSARLVLGPAGQAAALRLQLPAEAAYANLSFWAVPPVPWPQGQHPFLLMPLNELNDEHYTVYFCKLEPGAGPAADFCN